MILTGGTDHFIPRQVPPPADFGGWSDQEKMNFLGPRWRADAALFSEEALGVRLWSQSCDGPNDERGGQREMFDAVTLSRNVAIRAGQKGGKTLGLAAIALWWVCCFPDARVIITAATGRQVREQVWMEFTRLYRQARMHIGGRMNETPSGGLRFADGRSVIGFATDEATNMGGFSGRNLLAIVDEASGIAPKIYQAIEGNQASGGRIVLSGNPLEASGPFHDAFHKHKSLWTRLHMSSVDAARAKTEGRDRYGEANPFESLAGPDFVERMALKWGVDNPFYQIRVLGNFATQGERAIFSAFLVHEAGERWRDCKDEGRLEIGVDVARFGSDESVIAIRRGYKIYPLERFTKLDGIQLAAQVLLAIRKYARADDPGKPMVKVDTIGVGASVVDQLSVRNDLQVIAVNNSSSAESDGYTNLRAQLWFGLRDWLKEGGTLPPDDDLAGELVGINYEFDTQGRQKVESKDAIRERMGRSPDRADAVTLCVYQGGGAPVDLARTFAPSTTLTLDQLPASLDGLAAGGAGASVPGIGAGARAGHVFDDGSFVNTVIGAPGGMSHAPTPQGGSLTIDQIVAQQLHKQANPGSR